MKEPKINIISYQKANLIVGTWCEFPEVNRGLYLANTPDDKYVAIDNRDGNCWCEDFETITEAVFWLIDEPDDFPFCKISGCEALCKGCWRDCPNGIGDHKK